MILRRLGNKKRIAKEIQKHFPPHKVYVEPFFGAGGMFFNKPKAHNNIVNDLDSDVFNLFQVVSNQKDELKEAFALMPLHSDLMNYLKDNKETEPIKKALRFLMLSNFGVFGLETFGLGAKREDYQYKFPRLLELTSEKIIGTQFSNYDFRKFLNSIRFIKDGRNDEAKTFIYCDPPYLNTSDNYSDSFTEEDSNDLFDCLDSMNCKYAMSEFDNDFIIKQVKERGLNIIYIGERNNLKNKRTEILVTNYENNQKSLFE
jgi:DNA adenine methylase